MAASLTIAALNTLSVFPVLGSVFQSSLFQCAPAHARVRILDINFLIPHSEIEHPVIVDRQWLDVYPVQSWIAGLCLIPESGEGD